MKNSIFKVACLFALAMMAVVGCKKEQVKQFTDTYESEATALVDQTDNDVVYQTEAEDDGNGNISVIHEGIATDFLVISTDMDETEGPAGGNDSGSNKYRQHIRSHSFVACLRKLNLSERQTAAVKKSIAAYEDCRHGAIARARAIHAELQKAFRAKAERLISAYKDGKLTKEQFEAAMKELRQNFAKEMRSKHIQEKLDVALKTCYRKFLDNLKNILTEDQWKAFVRCHKR